MLLVIAACGGGRNAVHRDDPVPLEGGGAMDTSPSAGGRATTSHERMAITRLARMAERIRGLRFVRDVPVRVLDATAIRDALAHEMHDEDLAKSRELYVALGLLPADVDVRELMLRVLGEQVIGFYDTHTKALVVRDDVMAQLAARNGGNTLDESGMVLVHELVHALQDQDLGLGVAYDAREDAPTDASDAFRSLVEGDATLAMIGYLAERAGADLSAITGRPDLMSRIVQDAAPASGDELSRAPAIVREPLLSAYMDGMVFCAALHARGGFAAVDGAHRAPPRSTEQVLHPEKYFAGEEPEDVSLPPLPALDASGLTAVEDETMGELETRIYFEQGLDLDHARRAAEGWSGDRIRVYTNHATVRSVVWLTRWDSEADAIDAETAALLASVRTDASRQRVVRRGRDLLILRDVDPGLQDGLAASLLSPSPPSR